jgi:osmotically-inducible protein OsmY
MEGTETSVRMTSDGSSNSAGDVRARRIEKAVASRLRRNGYQAMRNITCFYRNGRLTLRGCVATYYLKQLAQTVVADIEGVETISNEIEVIALPPSDGW